MNKPSFIFENKEGKKVYCWNTQKSILFSIHRIDVQGGKFKEVLKESEEELHFVSQKLGLKDAQYKMLFESLYGKKEEKPKKQSSPFYIDIPELAQQRKILAEGMEKRISKTASTFGNDNIAQLAYIAGAADVPYSEVPEVYLSETTHRPTESYDYNPSSSFFDQTVVIDKPLEMTPVQDQPASLVEAKGAKIVLGKTEIKATANGLYEIKISNIPGHGTFQASLYKAIMGYLEDKLTALKDSNPDVAALELQSETELKGEDEEIKVPEGDEVDFGLEGGDNADPYAGTDTPAAPEANSDADILNQSKDASSASALGAPTL